MIKEAKASILNSISSSRAIVLKEIKKMEALRNQELTVRESLSLDSLIHELGETQSRLEIHETMIFQDIEYNSIHNVIKIPHSIVFAKGNGMDEMAQIVKSKLISAGKGDLYAIYIKYARLVGLEHFKHVTRHVVGDSE